MAEIEGDDVLSGVLVKQGTDLFKSWRRRFFVMSGLRLRWYDDKKAFDDASPPLGEITVGDIAALSAGKTCIKDFRGGREVLVRSDLGCALPPKFSLALPPLT